MINTPFTVIIPLLLIDLMSNETSLFASLASHFGDLLGQFVTGIGSGIFIGIILLKILKRPFSGLYSPMAVFVAVLTAFALAENLKGSGVLAVTSLGLFFGNTAVRQKVLLLEFESVLAKSLYILVFVLLGSLLLIPWSLQFFMISIVLFLAHLFVRFLALTFIVKKMEYSFSEKIFLTLMNPKGISVAIVSFVLLLSSLSVLKSLLDFVLIFMLYSIIFASLASWTAPWLVEDLRKKRGTLND
ncbi:cation:proton antiporter [Candidatus Woesearchaeota archaeon]|nr:cation:proton antiporter [Candidatus Woesearchaeota archaeon]